MSDNRAYWMTDPTPTPGTEAELRAQFVASLSHAQLKEVDAEGERVIELQADILMKVAETYATDRLKAALLRLKEQQYYTYDTGFRVPIAAIDAELARVSGEVV